MSFPLDSKQLLSPSRAAWILMVLFLVLSSLDLLLTWILLEFSEGLIYEANPIASSILKEHGWTGLCSFKASFTFFALIIGIIITYQRPMVGKKLFMSVCLCLLAVVTYSTSLLTLFYE